VRGDCRDWRQLGERGLPHVSPLQSSGALVVRDLSPSRKWGNTEGINPACHGELGER
jgi:hypothetical protein